MKKIAIFGDIHANLPALEAVLEDMDQHNLDAIYCLGDLVGYGTAPNEVIETVRGRGFPTLMGNYDQGVGNDSDDCGCAYKTPEARALGERSIAWSNAHTTDENKAFLRSLPMTIPIQLADTRILLVHGSPRKINEYLYEDRPDKSLERIMEGINAEVLICGHTHLPYDRLLPSGGRIINAGSVGKPKDGDTRACYIILSTENEALEVEFVRVPYDVEAAAQAIEATDMPNEFAAMLRSATG